MGWRSRYSHQGAWAYLKRHWNFVSFLQECILCTVLMTQNIRLHMYPRNLSQAFLYQFNIFSNSDPLISLKMQWIKQQIEFCKSRRSLLNRPEIIRRLFLVIVSLSRCCNKSWFPQITVEEFASRSTPEDMTISSQHKFLPICYYSGLLHKHFLFWLQANTSERINQWSFDWLQLTTGRLTDQFGHIFLLISVICLCIPTF